MDYKKLTVFNYQIAYYAFRLFTLYWIWEQICCYKIYSQRLPEFYNPKVWIQLMMFPSFPSAFYFGGLCLLLCLFLIWSLFQQKYWINILIFVFIFLVNLPIAGYHGMGHHSHIVVLFYFFSMFLLPKELNESDYKFVQYLNLGILITYSLAGMYKFISMTKDIVSGSPDLSWYERNAARINTEYNYYIIDRMLPQWMIDFYEYENLWIVLTLLGILFQTTCFLGAFNRKFLTFAMVFIVSFHLYTKFFVFADWKSTIYGVVFMFLPYHWFYTFLTNKLRFSTL
ncbi:hypothetical protein [Chryseobacterium salivictor]|uniref:HTTM domain-containing protein n=1 Tax=Chryseobacterium salivictor TaxID=2547600 RepID=A0A4P6ZC27_9FLAO|nr:hypothetical protein [Chryseobacterium salivictor]QBO56945.1 hypothetical protein NBC122_00085 [Chryseobacterium salivictor]